ncbi:MAG: hypothetical protein OEZ52_06450 [Candidatus Aminicenantes bacterium]|nr:hypothetical protein [Candidatus Aminicenantes bacterium]
MNEAHVQDILVSWLRKNGYGVRADFVMPSGNKIDVVADKDGDMWLVEVKGDYDKNTAQYNVNFDTALGQIIKSVMIVDKEIKYGICIPFSDMNRKLSGWLERYPDKRLLMPSHKVWHS